MSERLGLSSTTLHCRLFGARLSTSATRAWGCLGRRLSCPMPTYVRTVSTSARLWPASLVDGLARMIVALEHMHSLGLVHMDVKEHMDSLGLVRMDVKGSNILIDQAGDWYPGDFGSARDVNEAVFTTTPSFYPATPSASAACLRSPSTTGSWFMLLVTILIELMFKKLAWAKELCDTGRNVVTSPKVEQALAKAIVVTSPKVEQALAKVIVVTSPKVEQALAKTINSADVTAPLKSMLTTVVARAELSLSLSLPLPPQYSYVSRVVKERV